MQQGAVFRLEEAGGDGGVEKGEKAIPIAQRVDEDDGLGVEAELGPGDGFEHFFEGAVSAGEDEKCVGEFGHAGLALVHGCDEFEACEAAVGYLAVGEDVGEDTDDGCARGKDGIGDSAHKTGVGSPVDQAETSGGDGLAEGDGLRAEGGEVAVRRAAVDGDAARRVD